jgi:hypothetical protein
MKIVLTLLLTFFTLFVSGQFTTINPDTVCIGVNGSIYNVTNTPGYTYTWNVLPPGVIISGQGTSQIGVDWSSAPSGFIVNAISVFATDANGCQSQPVNLNVFIYEVLPSITQINPLCEGSPCVNLIGTPINGVFSGVGVINNQFCPTISGSGTFTITYTYSSGGCVFTTNSNIIVQPIPTLTPISHN